MEEVEVEVASGSAAKDFRYAAIYIHRSGRVLCRSEYLEIGPGFMNEHREYSGQF